MNKAVEERARAQCALDAETAGIRQTQIPETVERLWPVAAREMMGVIDTETLDEPVDMADRIKEYRRLRP